MPSGVENVDSNSTLYMYNNGVKICKACHFMVYSAMVGAPLQKNPSNPYGAASNCNLSPHIYIHSQEAYPVRVRQIIGDIEGRASLKCCHISIRISCTLDEYIEIFARIN